MEQTLTADTSGIADQDGLSNASYAYQWMGAGSNIAGATGSSYTLTASEQGQTIRVRVHFSDDSGNSETLTSAATVAVAAKPVPITASFDNVPGSHDGTATFTFDLHFSEEPKENFSYKTLRDHAFTVTGGQVIKARRLEKGKNAGVGDNRPAVRGRDGHHLAARDHRLPRAGRSLHGGRQDAVGQAGGDCIRAGRVEAERLARPRGPFGAGPPRGRRAVNRRVHPVRGRTTD